MAFAQPALLRRSMELYSPYTLLALLLCEHMQAFHIGAPVKVPAVLLPNHLPANVNDKAAEDRSIFVRTPATHV